MLLDRLKKTPIQTIFYLSSSLVLFEKEVVLLLAVGSGGKGSEAMSDFLLLFLRLDFGSAALEDIWLSALLLLAEPADVIKYGFKLHYCAEKQEGH